jgi:5-methylcytosine-specific restriction endonuclease McrA
MVYSIHSDHAFFYDSKDAKKGAAQLPKGPLKVAINAEPDLMKLRLPMDEDDATPFADMVEYPGFWTFYQNLLGVQDPDPVVYYCFSNQIKEIKADLELAGIPFWEGLGNRPETIRSLNLQFGRGKSSYGHDVKIRVVPENAWDLFYFCQTFREATTAPNRPHGLALTYNGEAIAALMNRALSRLAVTRRKEWTKKERQELLTRQKGYCPCCGDKLDKYEIDHVNPLCRGGTNDVGNLQALCLPCHADGAGGDGQDAHH